LCRKYSDFVDFFFWPKWRELYIQTSFNDERIFAKIITGWVGRGGMPSKPPFLIFKVRYPAK